MGPAIDWLEPTARNSNLLPVNANGLVRLRSPASRGRVGRVETPIFMVPPALVLLAPPLLDLLDDVLEHVAQEHRDDRRRGLVGPQPVVVAGVGHGEPEQVAVAGHRHQHGGQEDQELGVLVRAVAGPQEVVAQVVREAPVDVLARAVDPGERLLVEEQLEPVAVGLPLQGLHDQHVVVGGHVGVLEQRGQLVLAGRTSLCRVLTGTPSLYSSSSVSSMQARTRSGMAPK